MQEFDCSVQLIVEADDGKNPPNRTPVKITIVPAAREFSSANDAMGSRPALADSQLVTSGHSTLPYPLVGSIDVFSFSPTVRYFVANSHSNCFAVDSKTADLFFYDKNCTEISHGTETLQIAAVDSPFVTTANVRIARLPVESVTFSDRALILHGDPSMKLNLILVSIIILGHDQGR